MPSPELPMGDRFISRLINNPLTETGRTTRDLISDLSGTGTSSTKSVLVVTGSEPRPTATTVFWIGGSVQPTNMGPDDLWFSPTGTGPTGDTVAPSAPTNLSSSAITATSFTLTWTAADDNVGVTGYDIYRGGILAGSVSGLTANLTGLTAATTYSVTVRAKDAAGNVSAASSALSVTTDAGAGSPRHSIWGTTDYPYTTTKETDSPITVANGFYSYGTSPDMSAWRVIGMKIWIPTGITVTGPIACKGWFGVDTSLSAAPNATGTLTTPVSGQWNEVIFDTIIETNSGDTVWVGYKMPAGEYLFAEGTQIPSTYITALDGSHIVLHEGPRSKYLYDSGSGGESLNSPGYGIDVIYDEGPLI